MPVLPRARRSPNEALATTTTSEMRVRARQLVALLGQCTSLTDLHLCQTTSGLWKRGNLARLLIHFLFGGQSEILEEHVWASLPRLLTGIDEVQNRAWRSDYAGMS